MKAQIIKTGVTATLLIIAGQISTCFGRIQPHGHKHGDVFGRIMHKATASSGSSFTMEVTDGSNTILPKPTKVAFSDGCFGGDCDPVNATQDTNSMTHATQAPQAELQNLELREDPAITPQNRRRARYQKRSLEEDHSSKVIAPRQDGGYQSFVLGGFASPTSTSSAAPDGGYQSFVLSGFSSPTSTFSAAAASSSAPSSVCPAGNGTTYTSAAGINYRIICNVDYTDNDYPFQEVKTFAGCVQKCDAYNYDNHNFGCQAALFVPSRTGDSDDCYLKWSIAHPVAATLQIQGAIRLGYATNPSSSPAAGSSAPTASGTTSSSISIFTSTAAVSGTGYGGTSMSSKKATSASPPAAATSSASSTSSTAAAATSSAAVASSPGVTYASGDSIIAPKVAGTNLQGPTQNTPTTQYLDIESPAGITLASSLLTVGVNGDLTTGYELSLNTGVLEVNITTQSYLSPLTDNPHLSRDGGKGGMVNGQHLFIFCDTGSYSTTTSTTNGNFLGFVSSSVAIDVGMNGLNGKPLTLQDGIGEWSDNVGRQRGFAPLTEGEFAYNEAVQGNGQRYAVWPEASIIPLDATTGIIYAPIVYDNVNEVTKAAVFTYTGSTLLTITAGGKGGPVAERTVAKVFDQDEVEWGCVAGLRSWGPSGIGGNDGNVYLFGNVAGGLLLARVPAADVGDRNSFTYWDGNSWSSGMISTSSTAYFIEGAFMDVDVFYSPRHLTFIIVYLTIYADSTFYFRYLEADQGILPPFAPGGDKSADYVENILKYKWSEQQVLYKAAQGLSGKYIYSGGPHLGYYGSDDIINGGSKMLLSWTSPTGLDPSVLLSEYQIPTAEVTWA